MASNVYNVKQTLSPIKLVDSAGKIQKLLDAEIFEADGENIIFSLNLNPYSETDISMFIQCLQKYLNKGYIPRVNVNAEEFDFTISDFEEFIKLEKFTDDNGLELKFTDKSESYTLDESLYAFIKSKEFADYVNSTEASPFEKYLMVYRYLTSYIYQENHENYAKSRQLISILNSNDIVCVGYSKLLKYLCNSVGIDCEVQNLQIYTKNTDHVGGHQNNIVYIKDEKYGIDGYYYADACWDSIKKNKEPFLRYNYALLPLEDAGHFKNKKFNFYRSTAALYGNDVYEDMLLKSDVCKDVEEKFNFHIEKKALPLFFREANIEGSKLSNVAKQVKDMLINEGVPSDYLSMNKASSHPTCFYPEFFMAMMVIEPPRMDIVENNMKRLKEYLNSNYKLNQELSYAKYQHIYGYDPVRSSADNYHLYLRI